MGTIALLALFSFTLLGDTFSAARVGSSMHNNLRMHHMSGDSPNHQTWFSTREIHEMRIRLWDNRFMAIFYRIQWGFTKCEVSAMSTQKKILLVSKAAALKKTLLQDTTTVGCRQRKVWNNTLPFHYCLHNLSCKYYIRVQTTNLFKAVLYWLLLTLFQFGLTANIFW